MQALLSPRSYRRLRRHAGWSHRCSARRHSLSRPLVCLLICHRLTRPSSLDLFFLSCKRRASNEIDCRNETLPLRVTPPFRDNAAAERRVLRLGALAGAQCGGLWAATPPGANRAIPAPRWASRGARDASRSRDIKKRTQSKGSFDSRGDAPRETVFAAPSPPQARISLSAISQRGVVVLRRFR